MDGSPVSQGRVMEEIILLRLNIENHPENITLDVVDIKYQVILGIS